MWFDKSELYRTRNHFEIIWRESRQSNKQQTPVFSSHISGNIVVEPVKLITLTIKLFI